MDLVGQGTDDNCVLRELQISPAAACSKARLRSLEQKMILAPQFNPRQRFYCHLGARHRRLTWLGQSA